MRLSPAAAIVNILLLFPTLTTSQLVVAGIKPVPDSSSSSSSSSRRPLPRPEAGQLPAMPPPPPGPVTPPKQPSDGDATTPVQPAVPLTDILGTHRSLTTFSSLTRMHSSTETLLGDLSANITVLAPLNSAFDALPRKPWEDPRDYAALGAQAYLGGDGEDRARENLLRFVEAHLVMASPWEEGVKAATVGGRQIWWEKKGDKMVIRPDDVEVERVASRVANGEVWILRGVLNYA